MIDESASEFGGHSPEPLLCQPHQEEELATVNAIDLAEHRRCLAEQWRGIFAFTPRLVCDFHRILLKGIYASAGSYRQQFVSVDSFVPPQASTIEAHVIDMCAHANSLRDDVFHAAAYLLWRVSWIHPFYDGNGRAARALAMLALQVGSEVSERELARMMKLLAEDPYDQRYYTDLAATDRLAPESEGKCVTPVERLLLDLYFDAAT